MTTNSESSSRAKEENPLHLKSLPNLSKVKKNAASYIKDNPFKSLAYVAVSAFIFAKFI